MAKSKTPSFVVERRIMPTKQLYAFLMDCFDAANRMYNDVLREAETRRFALFDDIWYQRCVSEIKTLQHQIDKLGDPKNLQEKKLLKDLKRSLKKWKSEATGCRESYGFREYDLHKYVVELRNKQYAHALGVNIVQKIATQVWQAESKVMFGGGKHVHYRKRGQTDSFEDKTAVSGIIYHPAGPRRNKNQREKEYVSICGRNFHLKPVRKKDCWLQEAMRHRIKYCRIKRRPHGIRYRFFLELVLEGEPPIKHIIGNGICGIDPGVSTMSYCTERCVGMVVLSPNIATYQKHVKVAATVYERRRMANPENYTPDGTIRRNTKTFQKRWIHTKGMQRALMYLKTAYCKMSTYVKQSNGYDTNRVLMRSSNFNIEMMDYKALAKRAKECKRQGRVSAVKDKKGNVKTVHKYKRKKRYGASILKHAPAGFLRMLEVKVLRQGGNILHIDAWKYKASQYDHILDSYIKFGLNDRTKFVGCHRVQRDCYSAFLMMNASDAQHIDRDLCAKRFKQFLNNQGKAIAHMIHTIGDPTGNFGLSDFLNAKAM